MFLALAPLFLRRRWDRAPFALVPDVFDTLPVGFGVAVVVVGFVELPESGSPVVVGAGDPKCNWEVPPVALCTAGAFSFGVPITEDRPIARSATTATPPSIILERPPGSWDSPTNHVSQFFTRCPKPWGMQVPGQQMCAESLDRPGALQRIARCPVLMP